MATIYSNTYSVTSARGKNTAYARIGLNYSSNTSISEVTINANFFIQGYQTESSGSYEAIYTSIPRITIGSVVKDFTDYYEFESSGTNTSWSTISTGPNVSNSITRTHSEQKISVFFTLLKVSHTPPKPSDEICLMLSAFEPPDESGYDYGESYSEYSPITLSATVTVPALDSYAVSYNANGGDGAPSSQTKWYNESLTLSTTRPTRTNYTFLGWSTSSSATSAQYQPGDAYTGNAALTLYAVWKLNTYNVSYNANGGSGSIDTQTTIIGNNTTLASSGFTRTGYELSKWNTASDGSGTDYALGGTYPSGVSVTMYAVWTANTYVIKFNPNYPEKSPATSGSMEDQTITYDVPTALNANAFTAQEFSFYGWTEDPSSGTMYSAYKDQAVIKNLATNGTVNLYAQWNDVHSRPTLSNVTVVRCDSSGTASDDGDYANVTGTWTVTDSDYADTGGTLVASWRERGSNDEWSTKTTTFSSGTTENFSVICGDGAIDLTKNYDFIITFTDKFDTSASVSDLITQAFFTIDVLKGGHGISFGAPATEELFNVAMQARFAYLENTIRMYGDGILVCKTGSSVGALVNVNGTFDIVDVTWDGDNPTVERITSIDSKRMITKNYFMSIYSPLESSIHADSHIPSFTGSNDGDDPSVDSDYTTVTAYRNASGYNKASMEALNGSRSATIDVYVDQNGNVSKITLDASYNSAYDATTLIELLANKVHLNGTIAVDGAETVGSDLTVSGNTAVNTVTLGKSGGIWISGKTQSNSPIQWTTTGVTNGGRYDPIMWGKDDAGNVWNVGVDAAGGIGFYCFKAATTDDRVDGYAYLDTKDGIFKTINLQSGYLKSTGDLGVQGTTYVDGSVWSPYFIKKSTTIDTNQNPSYDIWDTMLSGRDTNYNEIGYVRIIKNTSGWQGVQIEAHRIINNNTYYNGLQLCIDNNGNPQVFVNSRNAWLNALGIYRGTMVVTGNGGDSYPMWNKSQFTSTFGRSFVPGTDFVAIMNGDGSATSAHFGSVTYGSDETVYAIFDRPVSSLIRINWLVILG